MELDQFKIIKKLLLWQHQLLEGLFNNNLHVNFANDKNKIGVIKIRRYLKFSNKHSCQLPQNSFKNIINEIKIRANSPISILPTSNILKFDSNQIPQLLNLCKN